MKEKAKKFIENSRKVPSNKGYGLWYLWTNRPSRDTSKIN